ncbi:hypothetical protein [Paracoccus salsus]|uniref:hypothetical protein n=1 Tax=Paracoccus salsus TaxID=2911061 RepID=UPI001F3714F3|nr:hypothetical protein [Paracoccus salsus]MCF3975061.1 hypothetical protein [Paracoccus salsus]
MPRWVCDDADDQDGNRADHFRFGLILHVINGLAPQISLRDIWYGRLPFVGMMVLGMILLAIFPQIALFLPELIMGPAL